MLRPLPVTCFGTACAGVVVWSLAGVVATGSSFAFDSIHYLPEPQVYPVKMMQARPSNDHARTGKGPRLLAAAQQPIVAADFAAGRGKSARHPNVAGIAAANGNAARFDAVAKQAGLTSEKLARLFDRPSSAKSRLPAAKFGAPAPERFASLPSGKTGQSQILLAYADPSPSGAAGIALSALLAPPLVHDLAASQDPNLDNAAAAQPVYEDLPSAVPLPQLRQPDDQARKPAAENSDGQQIEDPAAPKVDEPKTGRKRETPKPQKLSYARPNDQEKNKTGGSLGQALRNLFGGGTKAGNGVAVYDISAAKVYMPDGSVLEAHSGVGKMADDPRYVNVEMNGPTPSHTYNRRYQLKRLSALSFRTS